MNLAIELDWRGLAMKAADRGMVLRRFDSSVSACTPPPQKTPGKAHIQLPAEDVSFATSNTMSGP
jgi:hypothetical protein